MRNAVKHQLSDCVYTTLSVALLGTRLRLAGYGALGQLVLSQRLGWLVPQPTVTCKRCQLQRGERQSSREPLQLSNQFILYSSPYSSLRKGTASVNRKHRDSGTSSAEHRSRSHTAGNPRARLGLNRAFTFRPASTIPEVTHCSLQEKLRTALSPEHSVSPRQDTLRTGLQPLFVPGNSCTLKGKNAVDNFHLVGTFNFSFMFMSYVHECGLLYT